MEIRRPTSTMALVAILAIYASARGVEVATGFPQTSIVAFEVLSAMAFALVDGARHYGWRGILVFAAICAVIGNVVENIGVATGVPFGRYEFLELMGPRLFHVPVLLGPAYIGMAYVSWMLARLIVGSTSTPVVALPVASAIMVTWDWAQDPVWATLLHAWKWRDGGPWFGVPLSNYLGWFLTVTLIYIAFSIYLRKWPVGDSGRGRGALWPPIAFYALCAGGNAMQVFTRLPQQAAVDASGRTWLVADILAASALVSVFAMGGFAIAGAWRLLSSNADPSLRSG